MKACPLKFNHPAEAQQLHGLGPKLCDRLTDKLKAHCAENGLPMPEIPYKGILNAVQWKSHAHNVQAPRDNRTTKAKDRLGLQRNPKKHQSNISLHSDLVPLLYYLLS